MRKLYILVFFFLGYTSAFSQDLFISGIGGTKKFNYYDELADTLTVSNAGIVATSYMYVKIYLSIDNVQDASDKYVGSILVNGIAAGATRKVALNELQIKAPANAYNLIVRVDSENTINETDETNNTFVAQDYAVLAANVDMVISSFTLDRTTYTGNDQVYMSYEIKNIQPSNLGGPMHTSFYLSTDNTLSSNDTFLYDGYESFVGKDVVSGSDYLSIPAIAPGSYYFIAAVDDNNGVHTVTEIDETNNIALKTISITKSDIDLEISEISSAYAYAISGDYVNIDVSYNLRNNGTTGATGFYISAYLSDTPSPQPNPYRIGYTPYSGYWGYIKGGQTKGETAHFMPTLGQYHYGTQYLVMEVNVDNGYTGVLVEESNYTNNVLVCVIPIEIYPPAQSFSLSSATLAGQYDATDRTLQVDATFLNTGQASNVQAEHHVTITNASQQVVFEDYEYDYLYFYPGTSTTVQWSLQLDDPLPAGQYTIEVGCAFNSSSCGGSTTIPLTISAPAYTLSGTIKGEDNVLLTKGKLFLYQKGTDGVVKFINKIDPTQAETFSFPVDNQPYTLYFIPDRIAYPEYIPTILGKTLTLNANSFIELSQNTSVTLDVLKLASWPSGSKIIQGSVTSSDGSGSRVGIAGGRTQSLAEIPVVLLSDTGVPIRLAYTDAEGNYVFRDLPAAQYQVFASLELDGPLMTAPVLVDVTRTSATVTLALSDNGTIDTDIEPFFKSQTITFAMLPQKQYGDTPFAIEASADSELPLTYISSNPLVARVEDNNVVIYGVGTTEITASQEGNDDYKAADPVSRTLVVSAITAIEPAFGSVKLYPNPTTGIVVVEGAGSVSNASVTDALGKQGPDAALVDNRLDIRSLAPGVYFLTLQSTAGLKVFRVVKE